MDSSLSQEVPATTTRTTEKKKSLMLALRFFLVLVCSIIFFISLPFLVALVVVYFANLPIANPLSMLSRCKILSTSVDIRASKVCEPGFLNYNSIHILYPSERNKFRCRYDYYWASVFEVEYKDHFSGRMQVAFAEAPAEALPINCRPNFGAAWLAQYKFKINDTYDCWYTSGIPKVRLHNNNLFRCQPNEPSTMEMIRRYCILTIEMMESWLSIMVKSTHWRWGTIAGVVTGFSTSFISIVVLKLLERLVSSVFRSCVNWIMGTTLNAVHIKRAFFLVAYFSFTAWLAVEYGKRIGFMEIFDSL